MPGNKQRSSFHDGGLVQCSVEHCLKCPNKLFQLMVCEVVMLQLRIPMSFDSKIKNGRVVRNSRGVFEEKLKIGRVSKE